MNNNNNIIIIIIIIIKVEVIGCLVLFSNKGVGVLKTDKK